MEHQALDQIYADAQTIPFKLFIDSGIETTEATVIGIDSLIQQLTQVQDQLISSGYVIDHRKTERDHILFQRNDDPQKRIAVTYWAQKRKMI